MNKFDNQERRALAALVRSFTETEIAPGLRDWEAAGELPRSLHERAGDLVLLGCHEVAETTAHTVLRHHVASDLVDVLEIRTGSRARFAEDDLFGGTTAERHHDFSQ